MQYCAALAFGESANNNENKEDKEDAVIPNDFR